MLEIDAIDVHYGRMAAVRGATLSVQQREIVCIVGPNGAGKSTTMLTIAGAMKPTAGAVTFAGRPISGLSAERVAHLGISLVPEGRHIFGGLTVDENLRLGTHMRKDRAAVEKDVRLALEHFPFLAERLRQRAGKLSGGEQQQLAIARALLTRPKLMMIDEPSLGLAPRVVDDVYRAVRQLREDGMTLLIVEQSTERALAAADRIYVMRGGRIALSGGAEELRSDARMHEAYFGFSAAH